MSTSASSIRRCPLLAVLSLLLLAACGSSDQTAATKADILVSTDFDSLAGWMGTPPNPSLTREKAHSGRYSSKVGGSIEYGLTFANTLGELHEVRVKRLKISAWVFVPSAQASALFITHGGDAQPNAKPLIYNILDVVKAVDGNYGQWVPISKILELPDAVIYSTNIGFYLWRPSPSPESVYLDDLTVTAVPGT